MPTYFSRAMQVSDWHAHAKVRVAELVGWDGCACTYNV